MFYYGDRDRRALHSFPTRRSSDLSGLEDAVVVELDSVDGHVVTIRKPIRRRSEEHTSELQSPMYLVCRLLLEKKNRSEERISRNAETEMECRLMLEIRDKIGQPTH